MKSKASNLSQSIINIYLSIDHISMAVEKELILTLTIANSLDGFNTSVQNSEVEKLQRMN